MRAQVSLVQDTLFLRTCNVDGRAANMSKPTAEPSNATFPVANPEGFIAGGI